MGFSLLCCVHAVGAHAMVDDGEFKQQRLVLVSGVTAEECSLFHSQGVQSNLLSTTFRSKGLCILDYKLSFDPTGSSECLVEYTGLGEATLSRRRVLA